ncbi:GMC oxidoreductase [Xylariaceae sp. AK1471]|nr:GMC oxidoreductase [Xylariaceae sp. AK1471]
MPFSMVGSSRIEYFIALCVFVVVLILLLASPEETQPICRQFDLFTTREREIMAARILAQDRSRCHARAHSELKDKDDVVVICGGTAGLVVAARLTENENVSVLVLKAGENAIQDPRVAMSAIWSSILGTERGWDFTVPQGVYWEDPALLTPRSLYRPEPRTSTPGSHLAIPVGPGATWLRIFPSFTPSSIPDEAVKEHPNLGRIDGSTTGVNGPVQVAFTSSAQDPQSQAWHETFKNLGYGLQGNSFSGRAVGAWSIPGAIDAASGTRSYAATAYLVPANSRSNLQIATGAQVDKILLEVSRDGDRAVASGVAFKLADGTNHHVKAVREVMLAAGVFGSPKVLELSGIGNKTLLEKFSIEPKVDNISLDNGSQLRGCRRSHDRRLPPTSEPEFMQVLMQMYQEHKAGPLASQSLTSYAYMPIMSEVLEQLEPGLQTSLEKFVAQIDGEPKSEVERQHFNRIKSNLSSSSPFDAATASLFMLPPQVKLHGGPKQSGMTRDPKPSNFISLGASLQQPLSRGTSHISSLDPSAPPTIDPRYFSHPLDIELYARHIIGIEVLAKTAPLSNYLKAGGRRAQPGEPYVDTLEKGKAYVRQATLTNIYPVGTCAMLPRDSGGVVDERLKVYGVEGLRVVDSSIMPLSPCTNIQTTVYTVAENAADLIKEDHGLL